MTTRRVARRKQVVVVDYDSLWPVVFEELRSRVWPAVRDVAVSIEHVGSTAVPGLAAKPIIDMAVVVESESDVPLGIAALARAGYIHRGNLEVEGREAFFPPENLPAHDMYLCWEGSLGLVNQLGLRDYLRTHPDIAQRYGELKKGLARKFPNDIDSYIDGKTDLILEVLRQVGLAPEQLEAIEAANRRDGTNSG